METKGERVEPLFVEEEEPVFLVANDGVTKLPVSRKGAMEYCEMVATCLGSCEGDNTDIPSTYTDVRTLEKIIKYLNYHGETDEDGKLKNVPKTIPKPLPDNKLEKYVDIEDAKFAEELAQDQELLWKVLNASNHLGIIPLVNLLSAKVACMIKFKTPSQIRTMFNIPNPTTEEDAVAMDGNMDLLGE